MNISDTLGNYGGDFPTHLDTLGKGGLVTLTDIPNLTGISVTLNNKIPEARRSIGMIASFQIDTINYLYRYVFTDTWEPLTLENVQYVEWNLDSSGLIVDSDTAALIQLDTDFTTLNSIVSTGTSNLVTANIWSELNPIYRNTSNEVIQYKLYNGYPSIASIQALGAVKKIFSRTKNISEYSGDVLHINRPLYTTNNDKSNIQHANSFLDIRGNITTKKIKAVSGPIYLILSDIVGTSNTMSLPDWSSMYFYDGVSWTLHYVYPVYSEVLVMGEAVYILVPYGNTSNIYREDMHYPSITADVDNYHVSYNTNYIQASGGSGSLEVWDDNGASNDDNPGFVAATKLKVEGATTDVANGTATVTLPKNFYAITTPHTADTHTDFLNAQVPLEARKDGLIASFYSEVTSITYFYRCLTTSPGTWVDVGTATLTNFTYTDHTGDSFNDGDVIEEVFFDGATGYWSSANKKLTITLPTGSLEVWDDNGANNDGIAAYVAATQLKVEGATTDVANGVATVTLPPSGGNIVFSDDQDPANTITNPTKVTLTNTVLSIENTTEARIDISTSGTTVVNKYFDDYTFFVNTLAYTVSGTTYYPFYSGNITACKTLVDLNGGAIDASKEYIFHFDPSFVSHTNAPSGVIILSFLNSQRATFTIANHSNNYICLPALLFKSSNILPRWFGVTAWNNTNNNYVNANFVVIPATSSVTFKYVTSINDYLPVSFSKNYSNINIGYVLSLVSCISEYTSTDNQTSASFYYYKGVENAALLPINIQLEYFNILNNKFNFNSTSYFDYNNTTPCLSLDSSILNESFQDGKEYLFNISGWTAVTNTNAPDGVIMFALTGNSSLNNAKVTLANTSVNYLCIPQSVVTGGINNYSALMPVWAVSPGDTLYVLPPGALVTLIFISGQSYVINYSYSPPINTSGQVLTTVEVLYYPSSGINSFYLQRFI